MSDFLKITVLPAGNTIEFPEGTPVIDLIGEKGPEESLPVVAAKICNHYASLMDRITVECTIEPVSLGSTAGMRIYRNSLIYLFELVSRSVFPNRRVVIGHSLGHGFYLGFRDGGPPAVAEDAKLINLKM
jgi:uridine kinase